MNCRRVLGPARAARGASSTPAKDPDMRTPRPTNSDRVIIIKEKRHGCGCIFAALAAIALLGAWFVVNTSRELTEQGYASRRERATSGPLTATRHLDPMTDVTTYSVSIAGERMVDNVSYTPRLIVRVKPTAYARSAKKLDYTAEVYVAFEADGARRNSQTVEIRFDKDAPITADCATSTDRRAFWLPAGSLERLFNVNRLTVRYTTTLGAVRTYYFNVAALTSVNLTSAVAREVLNDRPKGVTINP